MSDLSKISVVLPSLDPDEKLLETVNGLLSHGFDDIILINDGSKAENLHFFETAAKNPGVQVLHHEVNRGKGAALKTAFTWFLANRPDRLGVVTVDGDNQHHPEDTKACALHLLATGKLTLGVRDFSLPHVPARSRSGNKITSFVFKVFVGMTISDTQTGLHAIGRKDLEVLNTVAGDRFEYETNMLLALKEYDIAFDEVKIRTVYIEENKSSHFHPIRDSWRIYKLIFAHFFKYTLSSLLSSVVDEGVYLLLSALLLSLSLGTWALTAICATTARLISSLMNFYTNHYLVFKSNTPVGKAMVKYFALAIPQFTVQLLLTYGVYTLFGIPDHRTILRGVIYGAVMCVLFVASFVIQKRWVFHKNK